MGDVNPEEDAALNEAMWENVRRGFFGVVGTDENGQARFRLTAAGKAYVEEMMRRTEEGG